METNATPPTHLRKKSLLYPTLTSKRRSMFLRPRPRMLPARRSRSRSHPSSRRSPPRQQYSMPRRPHPLAMQQRNRGQSQRCFTCNTREDKIYCGSKCYLPDPSYTRFGTPFECIQKGIMVGKLQERSRSRRSRRRRS